MPSRRAALLAYLEQHMGQLGSGLSTASGQVWEEHATALSAPGRRMGQHSSRASHFAGGPSAQFIIHSQGEGDIPIGGAGTWWPRQRSVVAALIILHVLALVYWLWAVFRKAAVAEAHEKNKRALMEPPRKVGYVTRPCSTCQKQYSYKQVHVIKCNCCFCM